MQVAAVACGRQIQPKTFKGEGKEKKGSSECEMPWKCVCVCVYVYACGCTWSRYWTEWKPVGRRRRAPLETVKVKEINSEKEKWQRADLNSWCPGISLYDG